jgi:hypothetical protein
MTVEIEPTNISSAVPAINGQMAQFVYALAAMAQDSKVPPFGLLKPGQLFRRIADYLRSQGVERRELPSRSTFDRFRRQFGHIYGIR